MMARLVMAILSTLAVEGAMVVVWHWVLPEFGVRLPLAALIAVMSAWAAFSVVDFWLVTRFLKQRAIVGLAHMIVGTKGTAASPLSPQGWVSIRGELWGAASDEGNIEKGEEVTVLEQDGLKLVVRRSRPDRATR